MTMSLNHLAPSVDGEAIAAMDACLQSSDNYKYAKIPSFSQW